MKRPLLMVALAYGCGILLADWLPWKLPLLPLFASSFALGLSAACWARARPYLIWPLLAAAGAVNLSLCQAILSPHDLRTLLADQPEIVFVKGALVETPYLRIYQHDEEQVSRTLAQIDVESIRRRNGAWQPAFGRITASCPGVLSNAFFGGRTVQIEGVLGRPRTPVAEGVFDYRRYLERHGIYYQLQVESTNDWRVADPGEAPAVPVADRFIAWSRRILARGLPVEDEPLRLLWAMTLGWRTALSGEVAEPFMRSGTMHVFAISGLHIALIAGLLVAVLRVLRVPRVTCGLIVLPLIWSYTGVTGWQASAIRSTIMMSVIIVGWALRRPSDLVNSLGAAAFIILVWDPQQLFQAGFQLSFFVVLGLALFVSIFDSLHVPLLKPDPNRPAGFLQRAVQQLPVLSLIFPDPLVPPELRPLHQRLLGPPLRWFLGALTTSLAAWIGSIPLIAYYFHLLTPVSLLANLVVVPLSSAALACNVASLAVGGWLPAAAELFNHSAWFFMVLMVWVSEWAARMPGGCFHIATPPAIAFVFYYACLVALLSGWLMRPRLRGWVAATLALLAAGWFLEWRHERSFAHVTIVPLNGGEAVYVQAARGSGDLLVDAGNESSASFILKPFLRGQGVNRLGQLLLTHGDIHNVGGARLVEELFKPRNVLHSDVAFRSTVYREIVRHFQKTPGLASSAKRGDKLGAWTVLHPEPGDRFPQADDNAIVLRGEVEGVRVLLLSDLGKPGQNALLERTADLRTDIVVSGIPVQTEPLADALLDAIQPRMIIITDSEYPAPQRANAKLRERLEARDVPLVYTRESGAVTLRLRDGRWETRTMAAAIRMKPSVGGN